MRQQMTIAKWRNRNRITIWKDPDDGFWGIRCPQGDAWWFTSHADCISFMDYCAEQERYGWEDQ